MNKALIELILLLFDKKNKNKNKGDIVINILKIILLMYVYYLSGLIAKYIRSKYLN